MRCIIGVAAIYWQFVKVLGRFISVPLPIHAVWERPEIPFLYNVEEDFSEQYEVSEKHPEIVKELVELAEKHKAEMKIKASVCDFGR
jgi:arylsulfatase A